MPAHRDAFTAAVTAYNLSHKPLPPVAARLLQAMFANSDTCQQTLEALGGRTGLGTQQVQKVLTALAAAGLFREDRVSG